MEYQKFIPEGWNPKEEYTFSQLEDAKKSGQIIQGLVTSCDENYNLHVNLGKNLMGIIPKDEFEIENNIKPSIYKNKENTCVQFKVIDTSGENVVLSRKAAKLEAFEWVRSDLNSRRCSLSVLLKILDHLVLLLKLEEEWLDFYI